MTDFEAFIGFKPLNEIATHLEQVPEFVSVVGKAVANNFKAALASNNKSDQKKALKDLFAALMNSKENEMKMQLQSLVDRASKLPQTKGSINELLVRLNQQFPGDIGCFCAFFLNYVQLKSGEAIFLAANEPHAYLSGGKLLLAAMTQ